MKQRGVCRAFLTALTVFSAASGMARGEELVVTPSTLNFTKQADSTELPALQTLQITSASGARVPFSYIFALTDFHGSLDNVIVVSPTSGVTPAVVTVGFDPAGFAKQTPPGMSLSLVFAAGAPPAPPVTEVRLTLTVTPPPAPLPTAIVNSATMHAGAIAPNELVSIFGSRLGPASDSTKALRYVPSAQPQLYYPSLSAGTVVTFNGIPAPILYATSGQINAVIPSGIYGAGTADVVVTRYGQSSAPIRVNVSESAPGILSLSQNGSGPGVTLNQNNTFNSAVNPAPKGSIVQLFGTGGGLFTQHVPDGWILVGNPPYPAPIVPVSVTIGGKAAAITYAGAAPIWVIGLIQVNAMVPLDVASGTQPIVLKIGSNTNDQQITLVVQ